MESLEDVGNDPHVGAIAVQVVGDEPAGALGLLDDEVTLAAQATVDERLEPELSPREDRLPGRGSGQRPHPHHFVRFHHQGSVVEDEGNRTAEVRRHLARRGVAPPGREHEPHPRRPGLVHRRPGSRGERLVAPKEGAVDIEGQQAKAAAHWPVHTSTRSITSPGRIFSTRSIPETTLPKSV